MEGWNHAVFQVQTLPSSSRELGLSVLCLQKGLLTTPRREAHLLGWGGAEPIQEGDLLTAPGRVGDGPDRPFQSRPPPRNQATDQDGE